MTFYPSINGEAREIFSLLFARSALDFNLVMTSRKRPAYRSTGAGINGPQFAMTDAAALRYIQEVVIKTLVSGWIGRRALGDSQHIVFLPSIRLRLHHRFGMFAVVSS